MILDSSVISTVVSVYSNKCMCVHKGKNNMGFKTVGVARKFNVDCKYLNINLRGKSDEYMYLFMCKIYNFTVLVIHDMQDEGYECKGATPQFHALIETHTQIGYLDPCMLITGPYLYKYMALYTA